MASIVERLRKPDFWRAVFHGDGKLSEQDEAAPFEAAASIELLAEALEAIELMACNHSGWVENDVWRGLGVIHEHARSALAQVRGDAPVSGGEG